MPITLGTITVGATGLPGWKVLQRTEARQIEVLNRDPGIKRSTEYLRNNLARVQKAEDLVKDYRLLSTALTAFGLEADLPNKAFIQKVLESDVSDRKSLVNRLADKRYLRFAEAFGYGASSLKDEEKPTDDLAKTISTAFVQREFERRIGEGDESLRLALNARRELQQMATRSSSDKTLWFEVIGNPPLRKVFQGAFGFQEGYTSLPIDRQYQEYTKAAKQFLGKNNFKEITTAEGTEALIQRFMVRSQLTNSSVQNRYNAAVSLLSRGQL